MSNSFPPQNATGPVVDRAEPWTRWWIPEDQWAAAGADQEFLGEHGGPSQSGTPFDDPIPGIAPLDHWEAEPFLLLLGRPGSGKSREMERAAEEG